jgi:hypothetical protein
MLVPLISGYIHSYKNAINVTLILEVNDVIDVCVD